MPRITATVYRTTSGKFSLRHTKGASVAGYYAIHEHDGDKRQAYEAAPSWTGNPQPGYYWINAHEPRA